MDNALYNPDWHKGWDSPYRALYNEIPVNIRLFGEYMLGRTAPITEMDMNWRDLNAIRDQYELQRRQQQDAYALNRSRQENVLQGSPELTIGGISGYGSDYDNQKVNEAVSRYERLAHLRRTPIEKYEGNTGLVDEYGWGKTLGNLLDPNSRIATSLGRYGVQETPYGTMAYDTYDFNKYGTENNEQLSWNMLRKTPVKFLDLAARKYGPPQGIPVQIMLPRRSQNESPR